jgi:hypothetical protein
MSSSRKERSDATPGRHAQWTPLFSRGGAAWMSGGTSVRSLPPGHARHVARWAALDVVGVLRRMGRPSMPTPGVKHQRPPPPIDRVRVGRPDAPASESYLYLWWWLTGGRSPSPLLKPRGSLYREDAHTVSCVS